MTSLPCVRHDQPGTDNPRLRAILADASQRAGRDLGDELASLYDYNDYLLATWRTHEARRLWSPALTAAWAAGLGDGSPILHLLSSQEDADLANDAIDKPVHN